MTDAEITENGTILNGELLPAKAVETITERLDRLEKAMEALQDPVVMEQQIATRVIARVQHEITAGPSSSNANSISSANTNTNSNTNGNGRANSAAGLTGRNGVSMGNMLPNALATVVMPALLNNNTEKVRLWSRLSVLREFPLMFRMYFDSRYRLSRVAQFGVPIVIGMMVMNYLLFAFWSLPLLSLVFPFIERAILIVLAVVLYKLLSREAARYDDVLNYLSRYTK